MVAMTKKDTRIRNTKVEVKYSSNISPFDVVAVNGKNEGKVITKTLRGTDGVYLHNVNFKVANNTPFLEGKLMGYVTPKLTEQGVEVKHSKGEKHFVRVDNGQPIRTARMVTIVDGLVRVVLD